MLETQISHVNSSYPTALFNLVQTVECPICHTSKSVLLEPAVYDAKLTEADILKFYSSSSDVKRMDAMVECTECALVYLNPRIREDILMKSYSTVEDPTFFDQNPGRIRTFRRLLKHALRIAKVAPSHEKKVLDVGCAGGAFPKAASDLGFTVTGVEPSRWLCEQGRRAYGLDLRPGILKEQGFEPSSFDLVTLWDVLEHLTDPSGELERIAKLLKPQGVLVISVPDYDSWARRILRRNWPFFLNVHLFYFNAKTLRRMLALYGFEVQGQFPLWQTLELGYVLKRAEAYFKVFGVVRWLLEKLGLSKLPCMYQMGQTVFVFKKRG